MLKFPATSPGKLNTPVYKVPAQVRNDRVFVKTVKVVSYNTRCKKCLKMTTELWEEGKKYVAKVYQNNCCMMWFRSMSFVHPRGKWHPRLPGPGAIPLAKRHGPAPSTAQQVIIYIFAWFWAPSISSLGALPMAKFPFTFFNALVMP